MSNNEKELELIERYQNNKDIDAYNELKEVYSEKLNVIIATSMLHKFFSVSEINEIADEAFKGILDRFDIKNTMNLSTYVFGSFQNELKREYYRKGGQLNNVSMDKFMRQEMQNKSETLKLFEIDASIYGRVTHNYMQVECNADEVIDSILEHYERKEGLYIINIRDENEKIRDGFKNVGDILKEFRNGAYWVEHNNNSFVLKIPRDHVEYKVSEVMFKDYDIIIKRKELNK